MRSPIESHFFSMLRFVRTLIHICVSTIPLANFAGALIHISISISPNFSGDAMRRVLVEFGVPLWFVI